MQTDARNNLLLTSSSSFEFSLNRLIETHAKKGYPGFYQQIASEITRTAHRRQVLEDFSKQLAAAAEHCYTTRNIEAVTNLSQALLHAAFPRQYQSIGWYYKALCLRRHGRADEALSILEQLTDAVPDGYKALVTLSLGAAYYEKSDLKLALEAFGEAATKAVTNSSWHVPTFLVAQRNIAVIRSIDGDHGGALDLLRRGFPLARWVGCRHPVLYYDFLNSVAVELLELGQTAQAQRVSKITLNTRFAHAFPEWRETYDEISRRQPLATGSIISIDEIAGRQNLVVLPIAARAKAANSPNLRLHGSWRAANVLNFLNWKTQMTNSHAKAQSQLPERPADERQEYDEKLAAELENMSVKQKRLRIMELISSGGISDDQLNRILMILQRPAAQQPTADEASTATGSPDVSAQRVSETESSYQSEEDSPDPDHQDDAS